MECFYVDESGYTGFNLLDKRQPLQGASAICIDNSDATQLINEHFPKRQFDELKYQDIARRQSYHQRIIALLRDLLKEFKCISFVCNKRYLLILMFLEYGFEPYCYAHDHDLYKDGENYCLGSLIYYEGQKFWGNKFDKLLLAFQTAVKEKNSDSIKNLISIAESLIQGELGCILLPLAKRFPECISSIMTEDVSTDAAFVVLHSLITQLETIATDIYKIEHDQSKNLLKYNEILHKMIQSDRPKEYVHSKIVGIKYPLKLSAITQVDSKNSPPVQLADTLIGAVLDSVNALFNSVHTKYTEKLISLFDGHENFSFTLPSKDFKREKEMRKGTQANEIIDFYAGILKG